MIIQKNTVLVPKELSIQGGAYIVCEVKMVAEDLSK